MFHHNGFLHSYWSGQFRNQPTRRSQRKGRSAADSRVTNHPFSFQLQKEPFEELGNKRKENWQEIKAKKAAQIAAADEMAKCIFQMQQSDAYTGCAELRNCLKNVHPEREEVKRVLEAEMQEMKDKLEDLSAALQA